MQNKPDNWNELSIDEKRAMRLDAWVNSAEHIQFEDLEARQNYIERITLFRDAVEMKKAPARVPASLMAGGFAIQRAGLLQVDTMYDRWENVAEAMIQFHRDFEPDTSSMVFLMSGAAMELLGLTTMKWPGCGLPDDSPYQALEIEHMTEDEYDHFINDPSDFMLRFYIPRANSALKGLRKLPQFLFEAMGMGGVGRAFADPEVQEAIDIMKKSVELSMIPFQVSFKMLNRLASMGYPSMAGLPLTPAGSAPFDFLGDQLRGTKGIMTDLYRNPDKVIAACEKILTLMPDPDIPLGGSPLVLIPLHKGDDAHMSDNQFEKFYWPTFRKSLLKLINEGMIPAPFAEGVYNRRLEIISDLPPKSTVWFFDQTDMHRAKDVLGDHFCLMGNVPISMIKAGTADQVTEYCKDLIDYCGRGGGFILSPGCQIDQGKEETVRALVNVAKEHLPS